jgi:hypothetical protein
MLTDKSTGRLAALLDFGWSFIGSFHEEFLRSFCDLRVIPGPFSEGEQLILRQWLLSDRSDQHNAEEPHDRLHRWYRMLETRGAQVPSELPGMEEASSLH